MAGPITQALLAALVLFCLQFRGFSNKDLREPLAQLLGIDPAKLTPAMMTYDLRRLRLHGLIERIPHSHRYQITQPVYALLCLHLQWI
jgi:DNA-binding HxlR family transcriptional regulator